MTRKDRELTEIQDILYVIHQCKVCRISFIDGNKPYIVPLNFGYTYKEGELTFYFHGALKGRKMELASAGGLAAFEMDCNHKLVRGEDACHFSFGYASVCGFGDVAVIEDMNERKLALKHLLIHQTGELPEFNDTMIAKTAVFKITAKEVTGKLHSAE